MEDHALHLKGNCHLMEGNEWHLNGNWCKIWQPKEHAISFFLKLGLKLKFH